MEKCRGRVNTLRKKLDVSTEEASGLKEANKVMHEQLCEHQWCLRQLELHHKEVQSRLEQVERENRAIYARSERTTSQLMQRLADAERSLKVALGDSEMKEASSQLAHKHSSVLDARLYDVCQERDNLHMQVASLERQKQELQACLESRAQAHQAQMDQLEARIDSDANQYSESAARVRALEGRCRDLERQVGLLSSQRAALEASLQTKCELEARRRDAVTSKLLKNAALAASLQEVHLDA